MEKLFLFFILLFTGLHLLAQEGTTYTEDEVIIDQKKTHIGLHIVPSTIMNYHNRVRLGLEFHRPKWSGILDFSYGDDWMPNGWNNDDQSFFEDYVFLGIRPEFRLHLNGIDELEGWDNIYLGLETAFTFYERTVRNNRFEGDGGVFSYDRATLQRVRHSAILKFGINLVTEAKIYFDIYVGLGAAYRQFGYQDIENPRFVPNTELFFEEIFRPNWKFVGSSIVPDFALGFRFGIYL